MQFKKKNALLDPLEIKVIGQRQCIELRRRTGEARGTRREARGARREATIYIFGRFQIRPDVDRVVALQPTHCFHFEAADIGSGYRCFQTCMLQSLRVEHATKNK